MMRLGLFLMLMLIYSSSWSQPTILRTQITKLIEQNEANPAIWAVIVRAENGQVVYQHQADLPMRPASNMKLITTAAFLDFYSPEDRITTYLYGLGRQVGSRWVGDLILVGSGDPSMDRNFFEHNPFQPFKNMANALQKRGITQITGSLIANDSFFDREPYPKSWEWDDLSFYYAPQIGALSFNSNCVELKVVAGQKPGETPTISWFPFNTPYVSFTNLQKVGQPGSKYEEYYRRMPGNNNIVLGSVLPPNYVEEEDLTVDEPALYTVDTFKRLLEREGIKVQGTAAVEHQSRDFSDQRYTVLASHESVELGDMIHQINKESDNFYTEMLLKRAAALEFKRAGSTENGLKIVRSYLAKQGLDTLQIVQSDGSGLSSKNLISVRAVSEVLLKMNIHPYKELYQNSLAIAGVDGTLDYRFHGHPAQGEIFAKTGYIGGARALSGYMTSSKGQKFVFSFITNNFTTKVREVDKVHEKILELLYTSL